MPAKAVAVPVERLLDDRLVEVGFPSWPSPLWIARALAPAAPREWATEREAGAAAAFVAGAVGVPALVAVCATFAAVAAVPLVLLAPVALALGLAWLAWRWNRVPPGAAPPSGAAPPPGAAHALPPPLSGTVLIR